MTERYAMPVFRSGPKAIYFSHVPKTGGSTVTEFFRNAGWDVDFVLEESPLSVNSMNYFLRTSPQHLEYRRACALFKSGAFEDLFMVVRHPIARFMSEFKYATRSADGGSMSHTQPDSWWQANRSIVEENPFHLDNHLRPQIDFLWPEMNVFKLEDGLEFIEQYDLKRPKSSTPIPWVGRQEAVLANLPERLKSEFKNFYSDDFELGEYSSEI